MSFKVVLNSSTQRFYVKNVSYASTINGTIGPTGDTLSYGVSNNTGTFDFGPSSGTKNWDVTYFTIRIDQGVCNVSGYTLTGYRIIAYSGSSYQFIKQLNSPSGQVQYSESDVTTGSIVNSITKIEIIPQYVAPQPATLQFYGNVMQGEGSITVSTNGESGPYSEITQFTSGQTLWVKATPASGYRFVEWNRTQQQSLTDNPWWIGARTEDTSVDAYFEKLGFVYSYDGTNWNQIQPKRFNDSTEIFEELQVKKFDGTDWVSY